MKELFSITLGRQLGSGGRQIGEKLAQQMGISFYDKELLDIASSESGLGKTFFEQFDENTRHSIWGVFPEWGASLGNAGFYFNNEALFQIQSDVIRDLAQEKSCLFVGRCADYILNEHSNCLRIFICADMSDRIKRVEEVQNLPVNKARDFLLKMDKKRAGYYNYYTGKVWGAAESYDLCINSSILGIDTTVSFIKQFVENWLK